MVPAMSNPPASAPARTHRLRNAAITFGIWTSIGLFYFSQAVLQRKLSGDPSPWWHSLAAWLAGVWIAALATPLILWLGRRFPVRRQGWPTAVLAHAGLAVGIAIAQLVLQAIVLSSLHVYPSVMKGPVAAFVLLFMLGFHQSVITYGVLLVMQAGWGYYRRYLERREEAARLMVRAAELQSQLSGAQLAALKAQLQPHFLFNTLNAIVSLVHQHRNSEAEEMLGRLADLLRALLEDTHSHEVSLRRELEYLRLYLAIEQVRFADRLRAEVTADDGLLDAQVPHLALQPVVENAIRHGLGRSAAASHIAVHARREGGRLVITVEDDGPGLSPRDPARPPGIGLANTRARLERLYGEAATLAIESREPRGVRVTMTLPYREPDAPSGEDHATYALHVPDR